MYHYLSIYNLALVEAIATHSTYFSSLFVHENSNAILRIQKTLLKTNPVYKKKYYCNLQFIKSRLFDHKPPPRHSHVLETSGNTKISLNYYTSGLAYPILSYPRALLHLYRPPAFRHRNVIVRLNHTRLTQDNVITRLTFRPLRSVCRAQSLPRFRPSSTPSSTKQVDKRSKT